MNEPSPNYEFLAPGKIAFGWGRRSEVGSLGRLLGRRAFIVSGSRSLEASGVMREIRESLAQAGVEPLSGVRISREPEVDDVDRGAALLRAQQVGPGDFVLALGGGAAMDLAKAIAGMATQRASQHVRDYLEGVGRGLQIEEPPLPVLAMPTTAGTGSEATKNAVITSYDPPFKKSLRCDLLMPRIVLVDPELTVGLPPAITAQTGMDAITQLIECYISRKARPIPRALAFSGLEAALPAITTAVREPASRPAREAMSHAALLSGMALANSGLGMAHGVAAALGALCRVPHGLACAVMLPIALRVNKEICIEEYAELARAIAVDTYLAPQEVAAEAFIDRIERTLAELGIPRRLSELGVCREHIPQLAAASRGNSMDGNPRAISDAELVRILEGAL